MMLRWCERHIVNQALSTSTKVLNPFLMCVSVCVVFQIFIDKHFIVTCLANHSIKEHLFRWIDPFSTITFSFGNTGNHPVSGEWKRLAWNRFLADIGHLQVWESANNSTKSDTAKLCDWNVSIYCLNQFCPTIIVYEKYNWVYRKNPAICGWSDRQLSYIKRT